MTRLEAILFALLAAAIVCNVHPKTTTTSIALALIVGVLVLLALMGVIHA